MAKHPSTFRIGGELQIHRLGFGAMRITGKGIWGPPDDRAGALATLRRLPELGVDFIDTANSYGPHVSEELIREALYPYTNVTIATKGGLERSGPDVWTQNGNPSHLVSEAHASRERLGVDQIALWQLHRIDAKVPRDEQFDVIKAMQSEGLIRHVGLSEVNVEEIKAAGKFFKVTTVQNLYNLGNRQSEEVLDYCDANNIGFIPWFPLAAGELAAEGSVLSKISSKLKASNGKVALAWLLKRSKVMLPIPGTGSVDHLIENIGGASIELSDEDFQALEHAAK